MTVHNRGLLTSRLTARAWPSGIPVHYSSSPKLVWDTCTYPVDRSDHMDIQLRAYGPLRARLEVCEKSDGRNQGTSEDTEDSSNTDAGNEVATAVEVFAETGRFRCVIETPKENSPVFLRVINTTPSSLLPAATTGSPPLLASVVTSWSVDPN